MSFHRENIIWQSADGTWSRGFYETYDTGGYGDDDYDPEWDVDYDFGALQWVSTGYATEQVARESWDGANPGGHSVLEWRDGQDENEKLDDMAAKLWAAHPPSPNRYSWERSHICNGTPKQRVPRYLAKDISEATVEAAHYKLGGYANLPTDVSAETAQLRERFPSLTEKQRAAVVAELSDGIERIRREMVSDGRDWVRRAAPAGSKEFAKAQIAALRSLAADAEPPRMGMAAPPPAAGASRAKTSAKSTNGSFAPKVNSAPDVTLG